MAAASIVRATSSLAVDTLFGTGQEAGTHHYFHQHGTGVNVVVLAGAKAVRGCSKFVFDITRGDGAIWVGGWPLRERFALLTSGGVFYNLFTGFAVIDEVVHRVKTDEAVGPRIKRNKWSLNTRVTVEFLVHRSQMIVTFEHHTHKLHFPFVVASGRGWSLCIALGIDNHIVLQSAVFNSAGSDTEELLLCNYRLGLFAGDIEPVFRSVGETKPKYTHGVVVKRKTSYYEGGGGEAAPVDTATAQDLVLIWLLSDAAPKSALKAVSVALAVV